MSEYRSLLRSPSAHLDGFDTEPPEKDVDDSSLDGLNLQKRKHYILVGVLVSILANVLLATLLVFALSSNGGDCASGVDAFYCEFSQMF